MNGTISNGMAVCQRLSPVLSEWAPFTRIATRPRTYGNIDTMVLDDDTTGKINFLLESLNMGAVELRRFMRTVANGLGIPCPRTPMAVLDEEDEES